MPSPHNKKKQNGHGGTGTGCKHNEVTSDEIEKVLGLGQLFGWTVGHRSTKTLKQYDTGNNNDVLNQLVNSANPPTVTKMR